ncbi:MAG: hypothetical protein WAL32_12625 [Terriglobales bacterium]
MSEPSSLPSAQTVDAAPQQASPSGHTDSETNSGLSPAKLPTSAKRSRLRHASSLAVIEPTQVEPQITHASTRPADQLEAQGEAFLYGTGGETDCELARTNLFIAAEHGDAEAQSVLGTMFATGHCVAADLPTAYHWLSRAQRQNPANPRIAGNLRIVWSEMTAEQQQAAARYSQ